MRTRTLLMIGLTVLAGLLVAGCVVRTVHVVDDDPPVEYGYQPMLYDGYVVYYTDAGVPFYWSGGLRVFVPLAFRPIYIDHWHSHRSAYVRWHSHRGDHYRSRHYRNRSHHRGYKPTRSRHKPVLHPGDRRDKPRLTPKKTGDHGSKPTLEPKKKKKKEKKKKEKRK